MRVQSTEFKLLSEFIAIEKLLIGLECVGQHMC